MMADDSPDWWLSNGVRLGDMPPKFWSTQCPSRGPGLRHRHQIGCPEGHGEDQCCECLGSEWAQFDAGEAEPQTTVMPPLDVNARLKSLGLMPNDGPPESLRPVPRRLMPWEQDAQPLEKHLAEAKAVTGNGPTGTLNGPGRGELTPRQQARLRAWAGWARYLDNAEAS